MSTPPRKGATRLIVRLHALLEALQDGTLTLAELSARLGAAYGSPQSLRRMLDRDCTHLAALGIIVERNVNPLRYTLRGSLPTYTAHELRILALFRDTFDAHHPQAAPILALLDRLTTDLPPAARRAYERRAVRRAPVRPAIDYSPYLACIETLECAIAIRQPVSFRYRPTSGHERRHTHVEPYEIEFYERHFYLVGYTALHRQIRDFRIDRISDLVGLEQRLPPDSERIRPMVRFRYRLVAALAQGEISQRFEAQHIIEHVANGDVIIEAQGRNAFFIIQTLLRYRNNAELLWPPALRAQMAVEVQRLAELYRKLPSAKAAGLYPGATRLTRLRVVWRTYSRPTGNIASRDYICMTSESAGCTNKRRLGFAVGLGDTAAVRTGTRGIARVYEMDRNARQCGLVDDEDPQLEKGPAMEGRAL